MGAYDERPRFYEGQYLSAAQLDAVVDYLRGGQARHALGSHTWGISIGLALVERPAPGAPNRREVILLPGYARDGFGRALLVQQPTRLPESPFAGIAYNPALDDPAAPGGAQGRLVRVWLQYAEVAGGAPAPGFDTCATDDTASKVQESFEFVIGDQAGALQRAPVTIGADSVDAQDALSHFDAAAGTLWDASVPHQALPTAGKPPRWLVPLGYVRWVAGNSTLGHFVDRGLVAADRVDERIRAFRRYGGTVGECIEAADGVIVLRRRTDKPDDPHRYAALLAGGQPLADLLADLVWVEGHLRVEGDARLAGGRLLLRNADGVDEGTGLYLARYGDGTGAAGNRELRVVIGDDAQGDNRFVVGPAQTAAPPPGVAPPLLNPCLAVVSHGRVGVNVRDPGVALHARGNRIRIESDDRTKRLDLRADGSAVDLHTDTHALYLRSNGPAAQNRNRVLINPLKSGGDGAVGIGTGSPAHGLDVAQPSVRFNLAEGNGGQLVLRSEPAAAAVDRVYVEAATGAGGAPAPELRFTGPGNADLPLLSSYAAVTYVRGRLGVNTATPAADTQVHVRGPRLRVQSGDGARSVDLRTDGSAVDLQSTTSHLYLRSTNPGGAPTRHIVMNPRPEDGNVGVGLSAPSEKLHVAGAFARVDGPAGEQACVGGEGHGAVVLGTRNAGVNIADMRNLTVAFDSTDPAAWLRVYCREVIEVSDARAKTDVKPLEGALDRVQRLRGVSFRWRSAAPQLQEERLGLIAQEVREVVPQAVTVSERGAGLSYSALVPVLVEAIKELKAALEAARADTVALKADAAALQPDVAALKAEAAALRSDVTGLKAEAAVLRSDVAVLKAEATALRSDVAALQARAETEARTAGTAEAAGTEPRAAGQASTGEPPAAPRPGRRTRKR